MLDRTTAPDAGDEEEFCLDDIVCAAMEQANFSQVGARLRLITVAAKDSDNTSVRFARSFPLISIWLS